MPVSSPAIAHARYYHRNLNPPKLIDIGFSQLPRSSTVARQVRIHAVPTHTKTPGFREMIKSDVPQVAKLLRRYLGRYDICQTFSRDEEVEHWFLSGQGKGKGTSRDGQVIWAYVVEVRSMIFTKIRIQRHI
jgi:glycylpeptide N-tetradecanoyltransferase